MEDEEEYGDSDSPVEDDFEEGEDEVEYEERSEEWVEDEGDSERSSTEGEYLEELHFALTNAERPGSFCTEGILKVFPLPGLEVARLGPIGLPLTEFQAKELARLCSQAPFGRREATIYDTSVRRCLQLSLDLFRLQGPEWTAQIQRLVNQEIKRGLGVPENAKVVPQLYKLLLYEPGGFFTAHRDSEKEDGMFGTLAIVLPSLHKGGELVVRHGGREELFDFASRCPYHVHWAAFYADCEHEVLPIKDGHRLVLVYNLVAQGSAGELAPADNRQAVQDVVAAVRIWSNDEDGPSKLVIALQHRYSSKSLSFNGLKGPDITTVDILRQAAKVPDRPPFHFFLGMLKVTEAGGEHDIGDTTFELTDIIAPPGETVRYSQLECDEEELMHMDALEDHGWDNERSMDTGNEGVTVERWYCHAALILWPHSKHWEVACVSNIGKAIKEVSDLANNAKRVQEVLEESLSAGGQLSYSDAALAVELVVEHGGVHALAELRRALHTICMHGGKLTSAQTQTLTQLLVQHGDANMAEALILHCFSPADALIIPTLASRFGWGALHAIILALIARFCERGSLTDCFNLLLRIAPEAPKTTPAFEKGASDTAGEGHVVEAAGTNLVERLGEGSSLTEEAAEQLVSGASTSRPAPVSTEVAIDLERRPSRSSCAAASRSSAPLREPLKSAPPLKLTIEEREREEVCQSAIATVIERISSRVESHSYSLNSQNMGPLAYLIELFGSAAFAPVTDALVQNTVRSSLTSAAGLLWHFVQLDSTKRPKGSPPISELTLCRQFALELVGRLKKEPQPEDRPYNAYLSPPRSSGFVVHFLRTLHLLKIDRMQLESVVAHFLATPSMYPIPGILLPALKELVAWFDMDNPWFTKLLMGCQEALERDCLEPPPEPKNWALPTTCDCLCRTCSRLLSFCHDPKRTEIEFSATGSVRQHLKDFIARHGVPLKTSEPNHKRLVFSKEGSDGKSDEAALMLLLKRRETYQQLQSARTQLLSLRQHVEPRLAGCRRPACGHSRPYVTSTPLANYLTICQTARKASAVSRLVMHHFELA